MACETRPLEGGVSLKGVHVTILLPRNLQILLRTLEIRDNEELGSVLADAFRGAHGALRRFIKTGTNPCRKHHMGFPVRVKVRGGRVALYLVFEHGSDERSGPVARVIYGSGKAQCQ